MTGVITSESLALPPERDGYPAPPDLAERRAQMGAAVAAGAFATKAPPVESTLAGLRCFRFEPEGVPRAFVLQLHGGGFRIGRPEFEGPFAEALVAHCDVAVAVPQYRLAPEAPFPSGLNDALAALVALREEAGDTPLIVSGDSAGAGLAASLGVLAAAGLAPRIDGVVLLSPWLDLTVTAASFEANADLDPLFGAESARIAADLYLQGLDLRHPLASPLFAEVDGFPPCLVSVGTGEVLLDDSRRFARKLEAAGCDCRVIEIAGMDHVAVVRGFELPGAAQTFAAIVGFVDHVAGGKPRPGED